MGCSHGLSFRNSGLPACLTGWLRTLFAPWRSSITQSSMKSCLPWMTSAWPRISSSRSLNMPGGAWRCCASMGEHSDKAASANMVVVQRGDLPKSSASRQMVLVVISKSPVLGTVHAPKNHHLLFDNKPIWGDVFRRYNNRAWFHSSRLGRRGARVGGPAYVVSVAESFGMNTARSGLYKKDSSLS